MKGPQKSLMNWGKQKWHTKVASLVLKLVSGIYLMRIKSLSDAEYAATTRAKRQGTKAVSNMYQPKKIAAK